MSQKKSDQNPNQAQQQTRYINSGLVEVSRNNAELRNVINKQRMWIGGGLLVIIFLIVAIIILSGILAKMPKTEAFQTIDNSVICKLNPNENPTFTDTNIAEFAKEAVLNAYAIDYQNADNSTTDVLRRYFTDRGRSSFITSLNQSGLIDQIKQNYLVLRTSAARTPEVTNNKGIDNLGNRFWIVQVPIRMEYFNGKSSPADSRNYLAEIRVEVTPRDVYNPKGFGVSSIILRTN
ncbi:DotI/IcmL family type IV secretion protein [Acinetobacter sp. Marseille-Q1618]|uniref:DotI/IcmL family type IV secretion protein n=1 Tax=Acinetobacter sp. Marseille-Q1618 TaxID=2697502 RepID=UPI0015707C7E|nr:DotI/IcmL family type IV secretion protein [Acinetobacter sp. Marseille-Q1618]